MFECVQAKQVIYADGSSRDFGRRERPHLVLNGTRPVAFSSAVTPMPTACVGKPHCLPRYPDASHTLVQRVRGASDALYQATSQGLVSSPPRTQCQLMKGVGFPKETSGGDLPCFSANDC